MAPSSRSIPDGPVQGRCSLQLSQKHKSEASDNRRLAQSVYDRSVLRLDFTSARAGRNPVAPVTPVSPLTVGARALGAGVPLPL